MREHLFQLIFSYISVSQVASRIDSTCYCTPLQNFSRRVRRQALPVVVWPVTSLAVLALSFAPSLRAQGSRPASRPPQGQLQTPFRADPAVAPARSEYRQGDSVSRGWPDAGPVRPPADRVAEFPGSPSRASASAAVFEPAQTIAWVGDQQIFRGDLIGEANLILAPTLENMSPEQIAADSETIAVQRENLVQRLLPGVIDRKLMYLEFLRDAPPDKLEEMLERIHSRIPEILERELLKMVQKLRTTKPDDYAELARQDNQLFRLALAMKDHNMTSLGQLDGYLRFYGSSLEKQKQTFAERSLGQQKIRDSINLNPDITHQEMLAYYRENVDEFQVPAQARWEQLTVRFDRAGGKERARAAIAEMGNQIFLGGKAFWAVAKERSHGPRAKEGGLHDWTEWGDLEVSRQINRAVFSLPKGELSDIIADAEGYHIVKVLDRHDAHVVPFRDAQLEIKTKLQAQKRSQEFASYVKRLRERTPFRTIYDQPAEQRIAEPSRGREGQFPR